MADGKITIDTKIDTSGAEKGIKDLNKSAQSGIDSIKSTILKATTAIAGLKIGQAIFKIGSDFEEGMSKVKAVSGATGEEMVLLSEKAKEMGAKTKFSATESAEAMLYMGMAGWKSQQMIDGLPGIMNLAAASGEELGLVSDIVTDALTAFGLQAKDSAGFADLLASASSNSNTNVSLLGESFKYVAPVAGALGISAQDTAFALGLMANAGIKGSQSGTALRASLTNLANPTKNMYMEMDKLGISLTDSNGKVKEGKVLYDELRTKFGTLTDAQKASSAATIFGKEAMSGMLAVINASDEDYNNLYDNLTNSAGSAEKMAKIMQDNLKGSLEELGGALETIGIAFYEKFSAPAKEAVDKVTDVLSELATKLGNGELDNALIGIATSIGTITAAIAVFKAGAVIMGVVKSWQEAQVAMALYKMTAEGTTISQGVLNGVFTIWETIVALLTGKITLATFATGLWTKATAALNAVWGANPIGIILVLIVAITGAIIYLWKTNEGFRNAVINAWNKIKETGEKVWGWLAKFFTEDIPNAWGVLMSYFNDIGDYFEQLWVDIKQAFSDGWGNIVSFFTESIPAWWSDVKQSFVDGWQVIANFFTETIPKMIEDIGEWFNELPYRIGYALGYALATVVKWGIDTWNKIKETCKNVYDSVTEWFNQLPGRIEEVFTTAYSNVVTWGMNTWNSIVETCTNVFKSIVEWFSKLPGVIWNWLVNAYNNITTWGRDTYNSMNQAANAAINAVVNWFSTLPSRLWEWLSNTLSRVAEFARNLGAKAWDAGSNMVTNITDAVRDLPSKFMDIGVNIVKGVWNGITGMGGWLASKVKGFFTGIVDGAKHALGIKSPSRVFRDQVGKYMAQGVGVGFEDETNDIQDSMSRNLSDLTAKMSATVDYETSKTSTGVIAKNSQRVSTEPTTLGDMKDGDVFIIKNYMDSEEISEYTYKKVDGKFALAGKRVR